jgi:WD40 repeat protein
LQNQNIFAFAMDAKKFVTVFGSMIEQSTPHLYLSALPFAPESSEVSKQFLPQFPLTLSPCTGKATDWPAILKVLRGHEGPVASIAWSPDGNLIASGSYDETICIWDAEMGTIVLEPL